MVVTIAQPVDGGPFGPGFVLNLDSTFVGPLPTGSFWRIDIIALDIPETVVQREDFPTDANSRIAFYRSDPAASQPIPFATKDTYHGAPLKLLAELRSPTAVLDSLQIDIVWDMTSGIPFAMWQVINAQSGANLAAAAIAEETNAAVHMGFPGLDRLPIGEFLGIPLAGAAARELVTPDRSGEGTLERNIGLVDVAAMGIEWEVVSFPPGNGVKQGAPDRWSRRVLDLQLVGTDASANEYTRDFASFDVDHYRWMFQGFGLTRIHYWIEPGVTVRFYWLISGI